MKSQCVTAKSVNNSIWRDAAIIRSHYEQLKFTQLKGTQIVEKLSSPKHTVTQPRIIERVPDREVRDNLFGIEKPWIVQFSINNKWIIRLTVKHVNVHTYVSGFSSLFLIKTKYRNRMNTPADMRIAISNKVPRFHEIISKKQLHKKNKGPFLLSTFQC